MDKRLLLAPMKNSTDYIQLMDNIKKKKTPIVTYGLNETQKSHIIYGIHDELKGQVCIITHNDTEAKQIHEDLKFYAGNKALLFPARDILFYNMEAISHSTEEERMAVIEKIIENESCIVVVSVEALLHQLPPPTSFIKNRISFEMGKTVDLDEVIETFILLGYERIDIVEERGQFGIRGDIIDIFPGSSETPFRIELFGDEIDSIRRFQVNTQRSMDKVDFVKIYPAKETVIGEIDIEKVIPKLYKDYESIDKKIDSNAKQNLEEKLEETIEKLKGLRDFRGIDRFLPYVYEESSTLLNYFNKDTIFILDDSNRLRDKADEYTGEFRQNFSVLMERGNVFPKQGKLILNYNKTVEKLKEHRLVVLSLLPKAIRDFPVKEIINFDARPMQSFNGKMESLIKEIKRLQHRGYKIVLVPGTEERASRLFEFLKDNRVDAGFNPTAKKDIVTGEIVIVSGNLRRGFEYIENKYALITDFEIYGVHKQQRKTAKRKGASLIRASMDLGPGDYVVHEGHGIGKYIGIEELKIEGIRKEYFKVAYLGEDFLYVPIDQADLIQKYMGSEDVPPRLNKLGSVEWARVKTKAKKAIEDMAEDLLRLHAEREKTKGFKFSEDTDWQKQFEDLFPYVETPDQLKCIEEVKRDMEKEKAMDRLLCGDVGYGKTEVSIRAAFKAVIDNKQVAFLVPTTILAQQHYNTFKQRFSGFPMNIEMLSRFKNPNEQKQILEGMRTGNIDIVIGTHRLLSKDVRFKDLGLLVVDEEQRFGVKSKETLKQLKKTVDVLTLTATPIPRTLHMSIIGIRDVSVIEEPPDERFPVQTYVLAYNEAVVADAITKEISRGGQVYYVYNRVQNIYKVANQLAQLVPQGRIAIAHGQMSERQLERVMLDYMDGEYDILVSTTIIETGLDISNVNTIIILDADKLGLSQLYQLRGRVGRSFRQGYAYLMYEKDKILSEVAEKRLKTIKEFTEFGAGFKIAMRDLEIRGAGNLLGGEQHGHMAAIGYDLYVKLLEETIRQLKGDRVEEFEDTIIEINVDAYIPEEYIKSQGHKIEIYKKIASIRDIDDMYKIEEEIKERFGSIPLNTQNLLVISYIKSISRPLKITAITQNGKSIRIRFRDDSMIDAERISSILHKYNRKITFNATAEPYFIYKVSTMDQNKMLLELRDIIETLTCR
ncbi:MAG TPA: transcription-repair coupling factor [Clostridia bacterium]|nr:transcription-repair coupling factor [Clostridia bacterium]